MKQANSAEPDLVTLTVRVSRDTADRLRVIAEAEYRPVAAELRRLIQTRVDEADLPHAA
jgi:predicted transcriptional regulator